MFAETLPLVEAAAASRPGHGRERNDDAFLLLDGRDPRVVARRSGTLFAVCDGVTAVQDGGWAARLACERLATFLEPDSPAGLDALLQLLNEIDWELRGKGHGRAASTLSVLWLAAGTAHVIHVGDTAVYRMRDGAVESLTPRRTGRRLDSYLGMGPSLNEVVQVRKLPIHTGDVFFIASDGVGLPPTAFGEAWWASGGSARTCAEALLARVAGSRGPDDATVLVVDVLGVEADEAA